MSGIVHRRHWVAGMLATMVLTGCARATRTTSGTPSSGVPTSSFTPASPVTATTESPSASATASVVPTPSPAPSPSSGKEPSTYLAIGGTNPNYGMTGLIEVSTATGRVVRQLVPPEPGGGAFWPTLPADRSVIYLQQGNGTCGAQINEISPTGTLIHAAIGAAPTPSDGEQVDGLPSVSPDGQMLAFHREICDIGVVPGFIVNQLVILSLATGRDLTTTSAALEPASPQAWSPDGRSLLAYTEASSGGTVHLLSIDTGGHITADRVLPPGAGCFYERGAVFDRVTDRIDVVRTCGSVGAVVVLDAVTGAVVGTLLNLPNAVPQLQAIDSSGRYLIYGSRNPASNGMSWFVLSGGRSLPLPAGSNIDMPASW